MDKISQEDLQLIRDLKSRAVLASTEAEKTIAEARTAEMEARYGILTVYMKYGLKMGEDTIAEDGTIMKNPISQEDPQEKPQGECQDE